VSNKYWNATITASSSSYYQFADGTSCHDHNAYVANHIPANNGSHVRFWQGSTWTNIRAGVHHDYVCSIIGMSDTSDQFNTPRDNLFNYWGAFKDTSGNLNYEEYYVLDHPAKHWSKPCGFSTADDGYIAQAQQTVGTETVNP
jgi:hypothetical protein